MKYRAAVIVVLSFFFVSSPMGRASDKDNPAAETYAKVELKGKLTADGDLVTEWKEVSSKKTGFSVFVRSGFELGGPYPSWELFVSDNRELQESAKRLIGKTVIVKGTAVVFLAGGFNGPTVTRIVVKVVSLEAARD